jgi:cytochrome c
MLAAPLASGAHAADERVIAYNTHCRTCHSTKAKDNRLGPSLHGIIGAKAGQNSGYGAYSGALNGLTWDEATLDRFIAGPSGVATGTTMNSPPVADPAERRKIIDFLKSPSGEEGGPGAEIQPK